MNGINGKETSLTAASPASRRNSSRRQTHDATDEEEIDDDEENAITTSSVAAQPTLTISQFSPMMGTHMTFTRTNTAAGQEVNLSIRETDDMQDIEFPQVTEEGEEEEEQPLELTVNGKEEEKPVNFSQTESASQHDDVDSDDSGSDGNLDDIDGI